MNGRLDGATEGETLSKVGLHFRGKMKLEKAWWGTECVREES